MVSDENRNGSSTFCREIGVEMSLVLLRSIYATYAAPFVRNRKGEPLSDPLLVRSPAVSPAHEPRLPPYCRPTRSKIIRARLTLSETTAVRRGEGRLISGSRARRTAAMIAAAMTSVELIRVCSCIFSAQASRSRAIARFISPISAPPIALA
jgi:hypothetical protein